MRINRFVLDTNIWISFFINRKEQLLVDYITTNKISFFYSDELLTEIERVLLYEHLLCYEINPKKALNFIKQISVHFTISYPIKNYVPDDWNDNFIIALALQTNSGYIASGDKHILKEKVMLELKYKKLKIITLSEFEQMMNMS